jgi:fructokinase
MRIGIDLGGTKIEGILLSPRGVIAKKIRVDTPPDTYNEILTTVCELIRTLQKNQAKTLKVGIGMPGAISRFTNAIKNCNAIPLNNKPLHTDIENQLGYPVRLENDANCFAMSEATFGAGKKHNSVFGVILGTGTGGGFVINKNVIQGANGITGEWGHNSIPDSARELIKEVRICYCGRRNCIETVLSGRGIRQTYFEISGEDIDAKKIAARATGGELFAKECLNLYCTQLAHCLASVVNILDPDIIVLGGGLSNIKQLYEKVLPEMHTHIFSDNIVTLISPPSFGDASGAIGAACLWPEETIN